MNNIVDINTDELKASAPIINYIKTFYKNKIVIVRENNNVAFAKCIFHVEDTASLAIYANGTYKCFGCGEHGDLITLVQKIENVDFQRACEIIANNVGYQLNYLPVNKDWEDYKDELDKHTRRYWINLQHNPDALNYLINIRKVSPEMINTFRLGFTDSNEYQYRQDMGNISNRLVFPILEHKRNNPKCIGMAYRGLKDEKPKYVNDKNQDGRDGEKQELNGVFIKGNVLYGMAQAYKGISESGFVFITEGYFDVIAMHQAGFKNTVGIMSASLSDEQIKAICSVTNNIILMLDNDNAGHIGMYRCVEKLILHGLRPMICIINGFKDPDEMCKAFSFDTNNIRSFIMNNLKDGIYSLVFKDINTYKEMVSKERIKVYNKAMSIINTIPNETVRNAYIKEIEKEIY